jgi:hypothetical protein
MRKVAMDMLLGLGICDLREQRWLDILIPEKHGLRHVADSGNIIIRLE